MEFFSNLTNSSRQRRWWLTAFWLIAQLHLIRAEEITLTKTPCIANLNEIYESEKSVDDDSIVRKYILCKNTDFHVALNFGEDGTPLDGQYPIPIGRPNVHILCGEDGRSENNCQLVRGLVHVGIVDEFGSGNKAENIIIQGLTFFRATSVNVIAMTQGEITIKDCIFKRNRNVASVYAVAPHFGQRRLSLFSNQAMLSFFEKHHRRTQEDKNATSSLTGLNVHITNCLFQDNVLGASPGADSTSIIFSVGASVTLRNSAIVATTQQTHKSQDIARLIYVQDAPITLNHNCFIENDDDLTPVLLQQGNIFAASNFNQRTTGNLPAPNCEFIARNSTSPAQLICEASDAETCTANDTPQYQYPCISYLDEIYFSEWDVTNSSIPRTYILCPNTVFRVGSRHDKDGTPQGGSYPIILGRSNIRVLCGADGSFENDCQVVNGVVQVAHFDEFQTGEPPIENALVQGVSFARASAINALVSGTGDVTFRDCTFKDNSNVASVFTQILKPRMRGQRKLASLLPSLIEPQSRALAKAEQQVDPESLVVLLDACFFINNTIGTAANPVAGLVSNHDATLTLSDSMIINTENKAAPDFLGYYEIGYLIGNFNGKLMLANNCFFHNEVTIAPIINQGMIDAKFNSGHQSMMPDFLASSEEMEEQSGTSRASNAEQEALDTAAIGARYNASLQTDPNASVPVDHKSARCEFIATIAEVEDGLASVNPEIVQFECEEFDSEECFRPEAPSQAPSVSPSVSQQPSLFSPSSMPSPISNNDNSGGSGVLAEETVLHEGRVSGSETGAQDSSATSSTSGTLFNAKSMCATYVSIIASLFFSR